MEKEVKVIKFTAVFEDENGVKYGCEIEGQGTAQMAAGLITALQPACRLKTTDK